MSDANTKHPLKKRSLSSYLSNVSTRREELEKISKQETPEEEDPASDQKPEDQPSDEPVLKAEKTDTSPPTETASIHDANQDDSSAIARESEASIQQNVLVERIANSHDGGLPDTKGKTSQPRRATISSSSSIRNVDIQSHQPFSRDQLRAMLKEPKRKTIDDFIEEEGLGATEDGDLSDGVLDKNTTDPVKEEKDIEYSDSDKDTDDVGSDDPTAPNSPIKLVRRKLVRGDQIDTTASSMFNNESDSELSDIDDTKNIALSSSLFRGGSSPIKETNKNSHNINSSPAQSVKIASVSKTDSNKKPHIAVSKRPKQKKGIYRDSGGRTRLQIACDKGKFDVVKKMIEEGGYDINDQDNAGNTALHEAALQGHIEIVELLVENGADVNIKSIEMFGDTPLIDASANGHLDVVKDLLKNGADPTIRNAKGLTAFESVDDESEFDDEEDQNILREIKKRLSVATKRWTHGAGFHKDKSNINDNNTGATDGPRFGDNNFENRKVGDSPPLATNIDEKAPEEEFYWTDVTSRAGKEKLFRASKEGHLPYVGTYVENGGKIDLRSFFESVKCGHEDITSIFLAFGFPVNQTSRENKTSALMVAVGRGHLGTVKLLLEAGADPSKTDKKGHTALYYAKNSIMGITNSEEILLIEKAMNNHSEGHSNDDDDNDDNNNNDNEEAYNHEAHGSGREKTQSPILTSRRNNTPKIEDEDDDDEIPNTAEINFSNSHDVKNTATSDSRKRHGDTENNDIHYPLDWKKRKTIALQDEEKLKSLSPLSTEPHSPKKLKSAEVNKIHEETASEREVRLKEEEEYRKKRIEKKRKKEQELLRKLADDEKKRIEEQEKQKILEMERLERATLEKAKQMEREKELEEISYRRAVRDFYPLGLKIINFNDKHDYKRFLPLYYIVDEKNNKLVLDLQVIILLKDMDTFSKDNNLISEKFPVDPTHLAPLWNMLKFIFLYGGSYDDDKNNKKEEKRFVVNFDGVDLDTKIGYELLEYRKFINLPMAWIKWDKVVIGDPTKKNEIEQSMIQISINESRKSQSDKLNDSQGLTRKSRCLRIPRELPVKFQYRMSISSILQQTSKEPLW
ncbi:hos4p [Saccharomyces arboricola H-6]|uniref:Hos4p n=1 Tax=Saccharomyces arboricola (strain H-6 / AS 2.3317 / CBS 10644) TaxID=1160507 RepID=J8Q3W3_SACAR|nr:hos4p [Saccharomyces arboricola H-6]